MVQFTEAGKEIIIDVIGKGQVLGETALFKRQNNFCDAIAMEAVHICSFSVAQFEDLIKNRPNIALSIISSLGQKLYAAQQQLGDTANHSVESKLVALLYRLVKEHGQSTDNGQVIPLSLTQEDMANMIGASRVMVTQLLKQFIDRGFLFKAGKYYAIKDQCLERNFGHTRVD